MKYTGIKWIGLIPDNWQLKRAKNCFYISKEQANDKNPTVLSLARSGIKVRDISTNEGQLAASYENYNPVQPGDLLLNPMDLYSGANCNMSEVNGVISPAYVNLRARIDLNPKFFDYYFKTQYWAMAMFAHGKGVSFDNRWTLTADALLNYYVPFPSNQIQNKIVDFLNKKTKLIDSLVDIENKQIDALNNYKKAVIRNLVFCGTKGKTVNSGISWIGMVNEQFKIYRIKDVFDILDDKRKPIAADLRSQDGDTLYDYYGASGAIDKIDDYTIDDDVLLIGEDGANLVLRNLPLIYELHGKAWVNNHAHILKPKRGNDYRFFLYALEALDINPFITGSAQPKLSQENLKRMLIPVPNLDTQVLIRELLDKKCDYINNLILLKEKKIETLEGYKKSLIFEYTTGKKEIIS